MSNPIAGSLLLMLSVTAAAGCRGTPGNPARPQVDAILQNVASYSLVTIKRDSEKPVLLLAPTNGFAAEVTRDYIVIGKRAFLAASVAPGQGTFPSNELRKIFRKNHYREPCDCRPLPTLGILLYDRDNAAIGSIVVDSHEQFYLQDRDGHGIAHTASREAFSAVMRRLSKNESR